MKKICVVTSTRAEYGLLRQLIHQINDAQDLTLQLIVTGSHLSPEFGMTVDEINSDNLKIDKKIEILLSSDTSTGISKAMGLALISFPDAFEELNPDAVLLLGDRYEILSIAIAATIARIPIIHLHGGEVTFGALDDCFRHCITKLSHIHCVAAEEYKKRVLQLGENPKYVFNVGGLGVDAIKSLPLLNKNELEKNLDISFSKKTFLITYHPETLSETSNAKNITALLDALSFFVDANLIFTMPNTDTDGRAIYKEIKLFCELNSNSKLFSSLGQLRYLSCLKYADVIIGNSSSALLEAPTFKIPAVNIGSRQDGRLKASSIVDCASSTDQILQAIELVLSKKFQSTLAQSVNPYGIGGSVQKIFKMLLSVDFHSLPRKTFFDLNNK